MIIKATNICPAILDLSSQERLQEDNYVEKIPFRLIIRPKQTIEVDDKYYSLVSIQSAIKRGYIEILDYNQQNVFSQEIKIPESITTNFSLTKVEILNRADYPQDAFEKYNANLDVIDANLGSGGPSNASWGHITGVISSQNDLQNALNSKANVSGQIFAGNISAINLTGINTGDQIADGVTITGNGTIGNPFTGASTFTLYVDSPLSGAGNSSSHLTVDLSSKQNLNTNLTSVSGLAYASNSFVKMTASNTFGLDTNTYLISEVDPIFTASNAFSITASDILNLSNVSGINTGDQIADGVTITGDGSIGNPFVAVIPDTTLYVDSPLSGAGNSSSHLTVDLSSKQNDNLNLTSISNLAYASNSFVKMTASNTFSLDTNTYLNLDQTIPQTITGGIPLLSSTHADFTLDHQIIDKEYADGLAGGGMKSWFFTKTVSDIGGMYKATTTYSPAVIQTIIASAIKNTETVIASFLTELQTNSYRVTDGSRFFYLTAITDSPQEYITLRGKIYTTDINGANPVLLRTSNFSIPVNDIVSTYSMNAWGSALNIPTTTRIKFDILATNIHTSDHDVTLSIEGDTFSRLDVPSPVGVTDLSSVLHLDQTIPQAFTGGSVTGSGLLKVTSGTLGLDTNTYLTVESDTLQSVMDRGNTTSVIITSTVPTGNSPLVVASNTVVTNLNADLLDGQHASFYANVSSLTSYAKLDGTNQPFTGTIIPRTGSAAASTAPIKLTSGTLLATPEVGAVEFLTDSFYGTIGTGASRKEFVQYNNAPALGTGIITPTIYPAADSTTAVKINKADNVTTVVTVDTTNSRVGIGTTPSTNLNVNSNSAEGNIVATFEGTDTTSDFTVGIPLGIKILNKSPGNNRGTSIDFSGYNLNSSESLFARIAEKNISVTAGAESGSLLFLTKNAGTIGERMRIDNAGNVGIGVTAPTSILHLKAGTATAGTAPLKLNSGTLLATPEAGALEFLTDAYYGTIGTGASRKEFVQYNNAPALGTGIITPTIYPAADSTTAVKINKADNVTTVVTVDTTNSRVGIGTTPSVTLDLTATAGTVPRIRQTAYQNAAVNDIIRVNGSSSLPTKVLAFENLGGFDWYGYGATGYGATSQASFRVFAREDFTNTSKGTYITFEATPNGSVTKQEVARMLGNGNVGFGGTSSPTSNFQIVQGTTGAGTVSSPGSSTTLTGVGTQFSNTFRVGDTITVSGETVRTIATITSSTVLDVTVAFSATPIVSATYALTGGTRLAISGNGNASFTGGTISHSATINNPLTSASWNLFSTTFNGTSDGLSAPRTYVFTGTFAGDYSYAGAFVARTNMNIKITGAGTALANAVAHAYVSNCNATNVADSTVVLLSTQHQWSAGNTGNVTSITYLLINTPQGGGAGNGAFTGAITGLNIANMGDTSSTTNTGVHISAQTKGGGNSYGVRLLNAAATGVWNIYADGTAQNYFSGNVGVGTGISVPTARLHLAAGTAAAGTAPLKFNSGTLLSAPEAGAVEFLTDAYYVTITNGAVREQVATVPNTVTFTNKRITKRIGTTASNANPTINTDNYDEYGLTAQAVDVTSFTTNLTGTPVDGDTFVIRVTGTASRAIGWGAKFAAGDVALPTTTIGTKTLVVSFKIVNAVSTTVWQCMASTNIGA